MDLRGSRRAADIGFIREIIGAEEDEVLLGAADARGDLRAHDDRDAHVAGEMAGFVVEVFAAGMRGAAAEAIGKLVFAQDGGEALDFRLVGRGEEDALLLRDEVADLLDEGRDGAVKAQRGARGELDFAERGVVVEDVDSAELVEIEAGVRRRAWPAESRAGDRYLPGE